MTTILSTYKVFKKFNQGKRVFSYKSYLLPFRYLIRYRACWLYVRRLSTYITQIIIGHYYWSIKNWRSVSKLLMNFLNTFSGCKHLNLWWKNPDEGCTYQFQNNLHHLSQICDLQSSSWNWAVLNWIHLSFQLSISDTSNNVQHTNSS